MRKYQFVVLMLLVGLMAVADPYPKDKEKETAGRLLTGKVLDRGRAPPYALLLPSAANCRRYGSKSISIPPHPLRFECLVPRQR